MSNPRAVSLLRSLVAAARGTMTGPPSDPVDDAAVRAGDQEAARRHVHTVLSVETRAPRADVLSAVRHGLRLPLGAGTVPEGALHLIRADESSIVIGSVLRHGSGFRGELVVRDRRGGALAEYAVDAWHERDGAVHGLRQLERVRSTVVRAVRSIDPVARVRDPAQVRR